MAAPRFSGPPNIYDQVYFSELVNSLRLYFTSQVDVKDPVLVALSKVKTVTAAAVSLGVADGGVVLVDTTANPVVITLPAADDALMYQFIIKRISAGANNATINAVSGNIDGVASQTLAAQYKSIIVRSDGSNYFIVAAV